MAEVHPSDVNPNLHKVTDFMGQSAKILYKATPLLWARGKTFRHACSLSVLFLEGIIPLTPYHLGSMEGESGPLIDKFISMTRNGLLTLSSEPAQSGTNIHTGETFEVTEATVEFFIEKRNIQHIQHLIDHDNVAVEYIDGSFSGTMGPSYTGVDPHVIHMFMIGDSSLGNELFDLLNEASYNFR